MSQVSRTIVKTYFETGDRPTQDQFGNLIDSAAWYDEAAPNALLSSYQALGSQIKALPLWGGLQDCTGGSLMTDRLIRILPVFLASAATITGVKWGQVTAGDYTADGYNGVALYSHSAGVLTLLASSADDGNIWKATSLTFNAKDFSSTYNAPAGLYFIGLLWCRSAVVTAPQIAAGSGQSNSFINAGDFTNGSRLTGGLSAQTSMPNNITMSALAAASTNLFSALY